MIHGEKIMPKGDVLEIEVEPCGIRAYRIHS